MIWPPADADELLDQWDGLGRPEIPLSPGMTIVSLETWLDVPRGVFLLGNWPTAADLDVVRRFLLEYTPEERAG